METAVMARTKGKPVEEVKREAARELPAARTKSKPVEGPKSGKRINEKPTVITIKGNPAWRDWVDRGARHCRTDVAKLIDAAVVDYLRARGFTEEAPER